MNIMKVMAADGLSFSVPIDSVCKIIEHFKKSGYVITLFIAYPLQSMMMLFVIKYC